MVFAQGGKAREVSPSIPTIPAAQLVGHDGPILDVVFTSKFGTTLRVRVLYRQQLNDDNVIRAWTEIVPSFIGRVQVDDNLLTIFLHFDLRVVLRRLRCLRIIVSLSFFLGTHKRIRSIFYFQSFTR